MVDRKINGPLMMPISEKYKDMGTIVVGKIESGHIRKGDDLIVMPNKAHVEVTAIYTEMEDEIDSAICGDNVRLRLRGIEDDDLSPGFVVSTPSQPVHAVRQFEAQLAILEHKSIICAGYSAVMHVHTLAEEVTLPVSNPQVPLMTELTFLSRHYYITSTKLRAVSRRSLHNSPRKVSCRISTYTMFLLIVRVCYRSKDCRFS